MCVQGLFSLSEELLNHSSLTVLQPALLLSLVSHVARQSCPSTAIINSIFCLYY